MNICFTFVQVAHFERSVPPVRVLVFGDDDDRAGRDGQLRLVDRLQDEEELLVQLQLGVIVWQKEEDMSLVNNH